MVKWIKKYSKIPIDNNDTLSEKILKTRGIPTDKQIDFLVPTESHTHHYDLMRNATKAVRTILKYTKENKNIVISGDPDADGVTSLVIMLKRIMDIDGFQGNLSYIYSQRDSGHGISAQLKNEENVKLLNSSDLLIIVDSSSNEVDGLKQCQELVEQVIILDHHEFNDLDTESEMDKLAIIVNPQHSQCEYSNKYLSGAGVVYKICQGLDDLEGKEGYSDMYLDLVAVGMVGDMMSVLELENRYLISQGLQNVHNIGLTRILKSGKINLYKYCSKDIGFTVAPLINASARMGQIELAIELLLVDNDTDAKKLRLQMDKLNKRRQKEQKEIFDKYSDGIDLSQKIILIVDNESNKGFNGLVAQNIAQKYHRPCFVVRNHNGTCSGSGRSYGGFNTQEFLSGLDWVEASGHTQSHGLTFPSEKLDELIEYIDSEMPDDIESELTYYYDCELDMDNLWEDIETIQGLNYITGSGFPEITVKVDSVMVEDRAVIGKTQETVKFTCESDLVLIKFKVNDEWNADVETFDTVSVIGTPIINEFYNFAKRENIRTPQVIINDIVKE